MSKRFGQNETTFLFPFILIKLISSRHRFVLQLTVVSIVNHAFGILHVIWTVWMPF